MRFWVSLFHLLAQSNNQEEEEQEESENEGTLLLVELLTLTSQLKLKMKGKRTCLRKEMHLNRPCSDQFSWSWIISFVHCKK